jgi:hypothetical protein
VILKRNMKKGRTFTKTHEKKTFKLSRKINWKTNAGNKTEKKKKRLMRKVQRSVLVWKMVLLRLKMWKLTVEN